MTYPGRHLALDPSTHRAGMKGSELRGSNVGREGYGQWHLGSLEQVSRVRW